MGQYHYVVNLDKREFLIDALRAALARVRGEK